jgi:hypothetical protein
MGRYRWCENRTSKVGTDTKNPHEASSPDSLHVIFWARARFCGQNAFLRRSLLGVLRRATPDAAQTEVCFQQALAIARYQQATSWELWAAMSLARLWQQQGKRAEAYELLAPIYSWFTEGFDTADLQEAKALLEELS